MAALNDWDVTDANNNAAPPDGWPENTMQYSEVNNTGRAVQGTLRRFFGDVNGSLQAGGVADAYTLTLNESGYTAYFAGMYFACEIMVTNTGASTINVNGIGVQSIVDRGGNALSANELLAGGIYEFRYDGTNFQLMGTLVGTATVASGVFTNSNNPDLVDTDVALNVGAADPNAAAHIEIGPSAIQAKADQTNDNRLDINSLGGLVNIGAQSGTGGVALFDDTAQILSSRPDGIEVSGASVNDPTVGGTQDTIINFANANLTQIGQIEWQGATAMDFTNRVHGGSVRLRAENTAGSVRSMLTADPDGVLALAHGVDGATKFTTATTGIDLRGALNNDPTAGGNQDVLLELSNSSGTRAGELGFFTAANLQLLNRVHGGHVVLGAETTGGTLQVGLEFDPDTSLDLYEGANDHLALSTTQNGIDVFGDAGVAAILDIIADTGEAANMGIRADNGGARLRVFSATGQTLLSQTAASGTVEDTWFTMNRNAGVAMHFNNDSVFATTGADQVTLGDAQAEHIMRFRASGTGLDATGSSDILMQYEGQTASNFIPFVRKGSDNGGLVFSSDEGVALAAGEAGTTLIDNQALTAEDLWIVADSVPRIISNVQTGWANRAEVSFNNGNINYTGNGTASDDLDLISVAGRVSLFDANDQVLMTRAGDGIELLGDGTDVILELSNDSGVQLGFIRSFVAASSSLEIRNTNGGDVSLFHANNEVVRTVTAGNGGLEANNTETGAGFERVLTESDLSGAAGTSVGAIRTTALSRTSTTTNTDDPVLSGFPLQPSAEYVVECVAIFDGNGSSAAGFRWNWDFNGQLANVETIAGRANSIQQDNSSINEMSYQFAQLGTKSTFDNNTIDETLMIHMGVVTQSDYVADTDMDFQWAQGTNSVNDTRIQEGSYVLVTRVA